VVRLRKAGEQFDRRLAYNECTAFWSTSLREESSLRQEIWPRLAFRSGPVQIISLRPSPLKASFDSSAVKKNRRGENPRTSLARAIALRITSSVPENPSPTFTCTGRMKQTEPRGLQSHLKRRHATERHESPRPLPMPTASTKTAQKTICSQDHPTELHRRGYSLSWERTFPRFIRHLTLRRLSSLSLDAHPSRDECSRSISRAAGAELGVFIVPLAVMVAPLQHLKIGSWSGFAHRVSLPGPQRTVVAGSAAVRIRHARRLGG